jgi:excisionase family DNA binding protein
MTLLTLRQAAKTVGVSRSTIYRKVDEGALSATTLPDGTKAIDTSELLRVFGELKPTGGDTLRESPATVPQEPAATASDSPEAAILKTQVELLREELKQAREREGRLLAMLEEEQRSRRAMEIRLLPAPKRSFVDALSGAIAKIRESMQRKV